MRPGNLPRCKRRPSLLGKVKIRKQSPRFLPLLNWEGWRLVAGVGLGLLASTAHAAVTITPADALTIKKAIAAQKGHVVLVNFWATWCGPCVAEFPAIVAVSQQYRRKGLSVIAVSADSRKDINAKVMPFLIKQRVTFPVYLERSADPEDFINAFDPTWQGDLPRTFIYNRQGRRVQTLTGEQTAQSLASAFEPYLKKSRHRRVPGL